MQKVNKIFLDGEFVDWIDANIHVLTHTLHYGGGVFEGIRCYKTSKGSAVFRLKEHIDRLFYSASVLEMDIGFTKKEIIQAILKLVKINNLEECYIRPLIFFGNKMGLNPKGADVRVCIAAWSWEAYLGDKELVSAKVPKYIRIHPDSTDNKAKICGNYANSILASLDAHKDGYDEALFLDYEGFVAEGPGENVFFVKNGKLLTPSSENILAGITRDSVIEMAKNEGIEVEEKKITIEEAESSDEAFFCGTAAEICPIGKINKVNIGNRKVGDVTAKIKQFYKETTKGEKQKYLHWLTFLE